jgi:hypothetical protein
MVVFGPGSFELMNVSYPFGLSLSKAGRCLGAVRTEPVEAGACWFGGRAGVEGGSRVVAPAGDSLSFASPKESKQRKGDPQSATPALRYGANLRRGGCGVRRRTHCAPAALRSDNCGESEHEAWALRRPCHPTTTPPQAQPAGGGQPNSRTATRAFASLGPVSRAQAPRAAQAGPSAAMARVDVRFAGSLLYAPGARRARGGMRVGARMLRELTHRSCPSGAPQARSEFCGAPRDRAPQVAPQRSEGVADSRVALSLVTFFRRDERKLLRRRAHTPAPALNPSMPFQPAHQGFCKLSPSSYTSRHSIATPLPVMARDALKSIAKSAC